MTAASREVLSLFPKFVVIAFLDPRLRLAGRATLIDSCNDGWKFDTSELGGKVKRMSTCITDVIEFEIVFAIVACGYSQCVCRLPSNCGPTIIAPGVKICVLWGPLWPSGYATGICCLRWPICSLREDLHGVCLDPSMGWYAEVDALCHLA